MKPVFCIPGVTGQDGSYAAEILLLAKIKVIGLSRNNKKKYKNLLNCIEDNNFIFLETFNSLKKPKIKQPNILTIKISSIL